MLCNCLLQRATWRRAGVCRALHSTERARLESAPRVTSQAIPSSGFGGLDQVCADKMVVSGALQCTLPEQTRDCIVG
eukprot:SAG11_NODE_692_length_7698_cov_4.143308_4_plen_77_part_00